MVAEIDGAVAGALTGRLIPVPYERGDAGDLDGVYAPLLELEAIAAGSWYLNVLGVHTEFRGVIVPHLRGYGTTRFLSGETSSRFDNCVRAARRRVLQNNLPGADVLARVARL